MMLFRTNDASNATHYNYVPGSDYTNGDTDINNAIRLNPSTDFPLQIGVLSNPIGGQDYTIRIFNGSNNCYTDVTLYVPETYCTNSCRYTFDAENLGGLSPSRGLDTDSWQVVSDASASGGQALQVLDNDDTIYSNSIDCCDGIGTNEAAMIAITIHVPTSGNYNLLLKTKANNGANNSFHYGLNGNRIGRVNTSTNNAYGWRIRSIGTLPTGFNTINIWQREDGLFIDSIIIENQGPSLALVRVDDPSCNTNDGSVRLDLTDVPDGIHSLGYEDENADPHTFSNVSVNSDSAIISGLASGIYNNLTIDVFGCTSSEDIDLTLANTCPEICDNGIDEDGDGFVDCDDPDCQVINMPIASDDVFQTCPAVGVYGNVVSMNDVNLQNPTFTITIPPLKGTLAINDLGVFSYTLADDECGVINFTYEVCNGLTGCCAMGNATINIGDGNAPVLQDVPADITISCDDEIPNPPLVTAIDACPIIAIDMVETDVSSPNSL